MKVKICGITRHEDAMLACTLGADYIGFIFYSKSSRYISPEKAALISDALPAGIKKVGVFVNEPVEAITNIFRETGIDVVQLHSAVQESDHWALRKLEIPYIRVARIGPAGVELSKARGYYAYLLDTYDPKEYGGTGKSFEWSAVKGLGERKKIFMSGGLTPGNVREAIRIVKPYAVDVSSGIESQPGIKDKDKMKEFISMAKAL